MARKIRPALIDPANRPRIEEWRLARGLSQQALADQIDAGNKSTIAGWETGSRDPSAVSLAAVAQALGITVADLFRSPTDVDLRFTPDEARLLERLRLASPRDRALIDQILDL